MTNREQKYIARLVKRADVLYSRIHNSGLRNLDDEKAELAALEWAVSLLTKCLE